MGLTIRKQDTLLDRLLEPRSNVEELNLNYDSITSFNLNRRKEIHINNYVSINYRM